MGETEKRLKLLEERTAILAEAMDHIIDHNAELAAAASLYLCHDTPECRANLVELLDAVVGRKLMKDRAMAKRGKQ